MYSQDPDVRRRRVKLRFFAYGVMTLATIAFAAMSLFYILGYRIGTSLEVERGGLLKFDSRPQNARVTLDGKDIEATPHQINAAAGTHTVSYSKDGYQGWQKTVNLRPGEVLWLNYARIVPTSITTSVVTELPSVHQTIASPNREWYLIHSSAASPEFTFVDARNESNIKHEQITLPERSFTPGKGKHVFEMQEWSRDSQFILVRHKVGATVEFIRVPREDPAKSENLNALFDLPLRSAQFASNNPSTLFAKDKDNTLYRLVFDNKDSPLEIARAVSAYDNLDASGLAFIGQASVEEGAEEKTAKAKNRALYIWQSNGRAPKELRSVPVGSDAFVAYSSYLARDYVSLVFQNSISVIQDPLKSAKTIISETMSTPAASLRASPGSRYFLAQNKTLLYVYDVELGRTYSFSTPGEKDQSLQWADDHHVVFTGGNNLRLAEFDGTNTQQITSVAGPYDVLLGADGEVMLSIGKNTTSGKFELQQSFLLTEADRSSFL